MLSPNMDHLRQATTNLDALFLKAKKIHDRRVLKIPLSFKYLKFKLIQSLKSIMELTVSKINHNIFGAL